MPKQYLPDVREMAVPMIRDDVDDYDTMTDAWHAARRH